MVIKRGSGWAAPADASLISGNALRRMDNRCTDKKSPKPAQAQHGDAQWRLAKLLVSEFALPADPGMPHDDALREAVSLAGLYEMREWRRQYLRMDRNALDRAAVRRHRSGRDARTRRGVQQARPQPKTCQVDEIVRNSDRHWPRRQRQRHGLGRSRPPNRHARRQGAGRCGHYSDRRPGVAGPLSRRRASCCALGRSRKTTKIATLRGRKPPSSARIGRVGHLGA
jgi:hypothetical protein